MIRLRVAVTADEPAVRAVAEAAYAPFVAEIGRRPAPMDGPFAARIAEGAVTVAEEADGTLIGYVIAHAEGADTWHVENLAVAPAAQGRGVGARLLAAAEARAREAGAETVTLYTNEAMRGAQAFYARAGYAETDRRIEAGFRRIHYARSLDGLPPAPGTPRHA